MQLPTLTVISCSHATKVRSSIVGWGDRYKRMNQLLFDKNRRGTLPFASRTPLHLMIFHNYFPSNLGTPSKKLPLNINSVIRSKLPLTCNFLSV